LNGFVDLVIICTNRRLDMSIFMIPECDESEEKHAPLVHRHR
jgi:hypothetical protein